MLTLGQRYRSAAILGEVPSAPFGRPVADQPEPGARMPHAWLGRDGARVSSHDLFTGGFVLLAGPRGEAWLEAAAEARAAAGVRLDAYQAGRDLADPGGAWPRFALPPGRRCSPARTATWPGSALKPAAPPRAGRVRHPGGRPVRPAARDDRRRPGGLARLAAHYAPMGEKMSRYLAGCSTADLAVVLAFMRTGRQAADEEITRIRQQGIRHATRRPRPS